MVLTTELGLKFLKFQMSLSFAKGGRLPIRLFSDPTQCLHVRLPRAALEVQLKNECFPKQTLLLENPTSLEVATDVGKQRPLKAAPRWKEGRQDDTGPF